MTTTIIKPHIRKPDIVGELTQKLKDEEAARNALEEKSKREETRPVAVDKPRRFLPGNVKNNPRDYIWIPQSEALIGTKTILHEINLYDTLYALGLEYPRHKMPTINQFITHWYNVLSASECKPFFQILLYADGTPVPKEEINHLWDYMSLTDRKSFKEKPFWTWLNAIFTTRSGRLSLDTDLTVTVDRKGEKHLSGSPVASITTRECCYYSLDFNQLGLPKSASDKNHYVQGENIFFSGPQDHCIATFLASSGQVMLECDRKPEIFSKFLGVLPIIENVKYEDLGGWEE